MSFKTPCGIELKIINLKGKDYLPVAERLVWFREVHPDWAIHTDIKENDDTASAVGTAWIKDATDRIIAMAHKHENAQGFDDYREKAETGAIGRALAFCGFGTQFATQDLDEGTERIVDAPRATAGQPQHIPNDQGPYIPKFGKFAGKELRLIGPKELQSYVNFLESSAAKDGKGLSQNAKDFIAEANKILDASDDKVDTLPF